MAGLIAWQVDQADPDSPECASLIAELSEALFGMTGDDGRSSFAGREETGVHFALARSSAGIAVGCGALCMLDPSLGEIKRMYARPGTKGVGSALIAHLCDVAIKAGLTRLVLSTRRLNTRAVAFYRRHGFAECAPYGRYVGRTESICLEKRIGPHL